MSCNPIYDKLMRCLKAVRAKTDFVPEAALVLGSGLGDYAEGIDCEYELPYSEIEGFPVSTVQGHDGRFIFGRVGDARVVCMKGRVHYYEGYNMEDVVLPVRLMGLLGAKVLFLTNASGGINPEFSGGDFMLVTDHIASFVPSPIIGANIDELGTRFPDMSHAYDPVLQQVLRDSASSLGIELKEGVYCQLTGPSFETPAEIRMLGRLGADAVGMSTAVETIAAGHMGMKVCCVSCIANKAAGLSGTKLTHEEVQKTADRVSASFKLLVSDSIARMKAKGLFV